MIESWTCLSVCPSARLSLCSSFRPFISPDVFIYISIDSFWNFVLFFFLVRLPVCLDRPVCLSVCLSSSLPVCLSVYLSVCSPACLPPCLPVRLPTCLSSVYLPAYLHIPPLPAFSTVFIAAGCGLDSLVTGQLFRAVGARWTFRGYGVVAAIMLPVSFSVDRRR